VEKFQPVIQLNKGFCDLPFGANKERAILLFGEPEEKQELSDDIFSSSTVLHYWSQGFSLFFDLLKNSAFESVELDNKDTLLFEVPLFTLREKELVSLMKDNGFALTETENHSWGEKRVTFDGAGLDCYYENNRMVSVNFSTSELGPIAFMN
jgi:hypothetical protein